MISNPWFTGVETIKRQTRAARVVVWLEGCKHVSSGWTPFLSQGRDISHKIHPSPLKLALLAAYLGGHPSLMINDLPPRPAQREVGAGAPLSAGAAADEAAPVSSW